jgi:hypothetical protein
VLNMAHAGQFDRRSTASFCSCAERIPCGAPLDDPPAGRRTKELDGRRLSASSRVDEGLLGEDDVVGGSGSLHGGRKMADDCGEVVMGEPRLSCASSRGRPV